MEALTALKTRRSIRRFLQKPVEREKLEQILECARFSPTAANRQPIKYALPGPELTGKVLQQLHWAGYLPDYEMTSRQLPQTLLLILGDLEISRDLQFSAGAAANQIMLAAHGLGIASCCLGMSAQARAQIMELLQLDTGRYELICAVALGYSDQSATTEDLTDSCKYRLDEQGNFVVPKRVARELLIEL